MEIIRHQQHGLCLCKLFGLFHFQGHKLVDGIEDRFLDACAGIEFVLGDDLVYFLVHPLGAPVPVSNRVADALSALVQQHKVHPPGVHAHADGNLAKFPAFLQAQLDLREQFVHIPDILAVFLHHPIGEAVHFLQYHPSVFQMSQDMAAAGGADINGEIIFA